MGHITQAKELLEKQQTCNHERVAFIIEEHKLIPQGYTWLQEQENVDLDSFPTINLVCKNVCLDCGLQLD